MKRKKLSYDTYQGEREMLSKMESTNYENYEKTILTLAASFLAFSLTFLGLFKSSEPQILVNQFLLVTSWILFSTSVIVTLLGFLVGAFSLRFEVKILEQALEDIGSLDKRNIWTTINYIFYIVSGTAFVAGVVFLILFCQSNLGLLIK